MTEPVEEIKPFADEAEWRAKLPEVMRPIAERYGKDKFEVAWQIGAAQEGLQNLGIAVQRNTQLMTYVQFSAGAVNQLAGWAMEAKGMTFQELRDIQLDVQRAAQLAGASRNEGGKIILPS